MDRDEIVRWLEQHPGQVHGEVPREMVERCEDAVRRHAAEHAWAAARAYVEGRMHEWEHEWGQHATESAVAREVCPMLAAELKRREPHVQPGEERALVGDEILNALEPEARAKVAEWVRELAQQVEHKIWLEIVRFTRRDGRRMARDGRASSDDSWEATENYAHKAAHVARMLIDDYEAQAASSPQ
ncbi:MAG TPA: hypothetical protein ENO23_10245 [Alphaproteobacteria bacterium]|nr:hypothetical protein [Alphaproteobacteria bacterium]